MFTAVLTKCVKYLCQDLFSSVDEYEEENSPLVAELRSVLSSSSQKSQTELLEKVLTPLMQREQQFTNISKPKVLLFLELCIYISEIEKKTNSLKIFFGQIILILLKCSNLSETEFSALINQLDKCGNLAFKGITSRDRLSIYVNLLERLSSGQTKNISESVRVCARLACQERKEYLDAFALVIQSSDSKSQSVKQHNGERMDALSMLVISIFGDIANGETADETENSEILTKYSQQMKAFETFIHGQFKEIINHQNPRSNRFLTSLINDICKQVYSPEYAIVATLFSTVVGSLITFISQSTLQTNHFLIDMTKQILKQLYQDTQTIKEFSSDMIFTLCVSNLKAKKSKHLGTVFCGVCEELGFFTLSQHDNNLAFCQDCAGFSQFNQEIQKIKNLVDIFVLEEDPFQQTIVYYLQDLFRRTANQNFLHSRNTIQFMHFLKIANQSMNASKKNNKTQSSKPKDLFIERMKEEIEETNEDFKSLGSVELDFFEFIFKARIREQLQMEEKLEFLLKFICALTDDNSSQLRTKSLQILSEIQGFNKSTKFEQYLSLRRLDQHMNVRLTCLRILESLFQNQEPTQFETEEDLRNRKDRYFRLIVDRFNDKEPQVRSVVLSFISSNVKTFTEDNQLKLTLTKELISRISKDTPDFQESYLEILTKIYFPCYQGKQQVSGKPMKVKKADQKKLAKSTLNKEEEQACANIFEIQKSFEVSNEILLRIFTHLKENKPDSQVFFRQLLSTSLGVLEEKAADRQERRYILGIIEVIMQMKGFISEIAEELFGIFQHYFSAFINERNQLTANQKIERAEINLCFIIVLEILQSICRSIPKKSLTSNHSFQSKISKLEDSLISLIQKENNIHVLKPLLQLSALSFIAAAQDIKKIADIFQQRYFYLKNAREDYYLPGRLADSTQKEQQSQQQIQNTLDVFKISTSIYVISIYAHAFIDTCFQALCVSVDDVSALILYFLQFPNERIQSASFENLVLMWEKQENLVFASQDLLNQIIKNPRTSPKLLILILNIFDRCLTKHIKQIDKKSHTQQKVRSTSSGKTPNDDEEFEHITSVIRDITLKSQEVCLLSQDLQLKQAALRLIGELIRENLLLFQQVGGNIIPLACDPDILVRTLANGIVQEESVKSKLNIRVCLKQGLRKSATYIDNTYSQFTIIEGSVGQNVSFFERINGVLRSNEGSLLCKLSLDILAEIQDWSYEDHEIAFFLSMLIISLNQITEGDLLNVLKGLRNISEKLFYDVKDFLKNPTGGNQTEQEVENYIETRNYDDNSDSESSQRAFIKANVLLMCLVVSHLIIWQSNILSQKYQSIDSFIERLQQSHEDTELKGQKVIKKFDGDGKLLDAVSDLFLEQMREFDCSDPEAMTMLRTKIKFMFSEQVQSNPIQILDLSALCREDLTVIHLSTNYQNQQKKQNNQKIKVKQITNKKQSASNSNSHKPKSYHSCKGSKKTKMDDLDSSLKTSQSVVNSFKMNLRARRNTPQYGLSSCSEDENDISDTLSQDEASSDNEDNTIY